MLTQSEYEGGRREEGGGKGEGVKGRRKKEEGRGRKEGPKGGERGRRGRKRKGERWTKKKEYLQKQI